eukprot:3642604-Rhodomonas_salina.3
MELLRFQRFLQLLSVRPGRTICCVRARLGGAGGRYQNLEVFLLFPTTDFRAASQSVPSHIRKNEGRVATPPPPFPLQHRMMRSPLRELLRVSCLPLPSSCL